MAVTTRYKIAEQVLRIVSGGNASDDSSIDIRDILALVDQERDAIIKREITDRFYTKSTAQAMGELEITGDFLTKETVNVTDDSYGTLNSHPISLPNDMSVFRVEADPPSLTKAKRTLTISTGVTASATTDDIARFMFSPGPLRLEEKYRISFTVNVEAESENTIAETYDINFTVNTKSGRQASGQNRDNARWSNINLLEAIISDKNARKICNDIGIYFTSTDQDPSSNSRLVMAARYSFTITNFKINGDESGGSHGFSWAQAHSAGSTDATPNSTSIMVILESGNIYSLHYQLSETDAVAASDVAQNFVDKNAYKMSIEDNINMTISGAVISFEEIIPQGGFNVDKMVVSTNGDIAYSLQALDSYTTEPDATAREYERKIYTRMPSSGSHNVMYNKTILKSGKRFFYTEGNLIYLYKNTDSIDTLTVHYIASSRTLSDTSAYPLPGDYETEIISNLVQVFGLMKQAVEDVTNDNVG